MVKIVEKPLKLGRSTTTGRFVVRDKTGKTTTIYTVDTHSKTFASDLSKAFRSNVDAALRSKK